MQIPKDKIMDMIKGQGDTQKEQQADSELPDQVDTENSEHKSILDKLGINVGDLMGGGGIGSKLGL